VAFIPISITSPWKPASNRRRPPTASAPGPSPLGTGIPQPRPPRVYIVAAELAPSHRRLAVRRNLKTGRFKGAASTASPSSILLDRGVLGVNATYSQADTGTGAVHTAPSHGADDFYTGQRYGLDPTCASRPEATSTSIPLLAPAAPPPLKAKPVWPPPHHRRPA